MGNIINEVKKKQDKLSIYALDQPGKAQQLEALSEITEAPIMRLDSLKLLEPLLKIQNKYLLIIPGRMKDEVLTYFDKVKFEVRIIIFCQVIEYHIAAKSHPLVLDVTNIYEQLINIIKKQWNSGFSRQKPRTEICIYDSIVRYYKRRYCVEIDKNVFSIYQPIASDNFNPQNVQRFYGKVFNSEESFKSLIKLFVPYNSNIKYVTDKDFVREVLSLLFEIQQFRDKINFELQKKQNPKLVSSPEIEAIMMVLVYNYYWVYQNRERVTKYYKQLKIQNTDTVKNLRLNSVVEINDFMIVSQIRIPGKQWYLVIYTHQQYENPLMYHNVCPLPSKRAIYAPYTRFIVRAVDYESKQIIVAESPENMYLDWMFKQHKRDTNEIQDRLIALKSNRLTQQQRFYCLFDIAKLDLKHLTSGYPTKSTFIKSNVDFDVMHELRRCVKDRDLIKKLQLKIQTMALQYNFFFKDIVPQVLEIKYDDFSLEDLKYYFYTLIDLQKKIDKLDWKVVKNYLDLFKDSYKQERYYQTLILYQCREGDTDLGQLIKAIQVFSGPDYYLLSNLWAKLGYKKAQKAIKQRDIPLSNDAINCLKTAIDIISRINTEELSLIEIYRCLSDLFRFKSYKIEADYYLSQAKRLQKLYGKR